MTTLTDLASRYRWELMLLIGIPLIERTSWWLLPHILGNFNLSLAVWPCPPDYSCLPRYVSLFLNISLYLLGFFFFHVRRMGRTTLSLLWAFVFVNEAVTTAVYLPSNFIDPEQALELWWAWWSGAVWPQEWWKLFVSDLPQMMVWVWFARRASRTGFNHALVFIGLAIAFSSTNQNVPNLVFALLEDRAVSWDFTALGLAGNLFALWVLLRLGVAREKHEPDIERWVGSWDIPVFGAALRRLAVRVLPLFDPARGISKELLVALFALNWLQSAYLSLRGWVVYDLELAIFIEAIVVPVFVYWPLWTVLVILLAYGVRVRQPRERPATTEPTTTG